MELFPGDCGMKDRTTTMLGCPAEKESQNGNSCPLLPTNVSIELCDAETGAEDVENDVGFIHREVGSHPANREDLDQLRDRISRHHPRSQY